MYSLNLISCLILLGLGSIYVLTKPLSIGSKIQSDASGLSLPDKIFLDDIALALVQNFDESSSSDDEPLIFDEGNVPADGNNGNVSSGGNGSNGSIIGADGKSGNSKSGVVSAQDGTSTDLHNTTVKADGTVVDDKGNTVAKVSNDGKITDNNGNRVGTLDPSGKITDNDGTVVANVAEDGKVNPAPVYGNGGVVSAPDGTATDLSNTTVDKDGNVVDKNGNTVAKVDKDGNITDSKGNKVGTLEDGKIVDNKGNTVATVDKNGNVAPAPIKNAGNNANTGSNPQIVDENSRDADNKRKGSFLYFLFPALALIGGAGAYIYKNKYVDEVLGDAPENESLNKMNNMGAAPTAAAAPTTTTTTTTTTTKTTGTTLPYDTVGNGKTTTTTTTTKYSNIAPIESLPNIETGPSMDTLIKDEFASPINETKTSDLGILPAVLAAGATAGAAAAAPKKKTTKTTTTTKTTYGNAPSSSTTSSTKYIYNNQPNTYETRYGPSTYTTTTTTTSSKKSDPRYLYAAAPLAAGAALAATKKPKKTVKETVNSYNTVSSSEKTLPLVAGKKPEEEEIVEEYIVEHGRPNPKKTVKRTVYKTIYKNGKAIKVPVDDVEADPKDLTMTTSPDSPEEIVEEYIIEEGSKKVPKTKKTVKRTVYKTIYKNGKAIQVPVEEEMEVPYETKNVTSSTTTTSKSSFVPVVVPVGGPSSEKKETVETTEKTSVNPYMGMVPMVIETIVKHATGDKNDDEKTKDYEQLMSKVTEFNKGSPVTGEGEEVEYVIENGVRVPKTKKTIKRTIYKTIFKNGKPVQVPVDENETEKTTYGYQKTIKSPRLMGIKKRVTTYVNKDGKDIPHTEEFSLNPKDVSPEELPEEYKEFSSEELEVPTITSPRQKQKTIKKYITVYKTIYKNGKPEEIVENIEIPEGKTPEEVLASLPRGAHVKPEGDAKDPIEKRYVTSNVIEPPTKQTVAEERVVKPTTIKSPKIHAVKKYVTTYKTTYKNGVPVEEVTESEDLPDVTEKTYGSPTEPLDDDEALKSPRLKTIKRVSTYKTTYKNGVPVEVVEEEPEEFVLDANPVLIEPDSETTLIKSPKMKLFKKTIEEEPEEYILEDGVKKPKTTKTIKKTIYKTIYKNGVPIQVPVDFDERDGPIEVPTVDGEEVDGDKKPKTKTTTTTTTTVKKGPVTTTITDKDMEEIVEEYLIEEGEDGKPKKTVKRTTYRNGVPVHEEFEEVDEIPTDAMETEEIVEEYEIEEGKDKSPKSLKKTVYKTIYKDGVPVKVPVTVDEETTFTEDRGVVGDMISSVVGGQSENPYMKLAPSIIEMIVKYALPNAKDNDSNADLTGLLSQVNSISKLLGSREAPETTTTTTTDGDKTTTRDVKTTTEGGKTITTTRTTTTRTITTKNGKTVETTENTDRGLIGDMVTNAVASKITSGLTSTSTQQENPFMKIAPSVIEMIVKYALPNAKENDSQSDLAGLMNQVNSISKLLGSREVVETREVIEVPEGEDGEKDGEEIEEEYIFEDGQDKPTSKIVRKTVYKNGVKISSTEEVQKVDEEEANSIKPLATTTTTVITTEERNTEENKEERSEALPSIIEEDETKEYVDHIEPSNTFNNISTFNTTRTSSTTAPKRSSSKRLSSELKAAVAAELAKLENEINDETKHIPKPRKQSIKTLPRKESKQSIKALAEGCLVRKPSNASSIKSSHSVVEDWSGPVFEKKVFEVVLEHTPQLPDEVKLNIGDLVEVKQVFEDGWAYGINTATKLDGTFPVICLGEEREPNQNGRYVPRLVRVYQAREEAGKKEIEDEDNVKQALTEFARKKKEYKLKKQAKRSSQ